MKNFTDRRLGVWYPRKPISLHVYCRSSRKWCHVQLFCDDPIVFMEDLTEESRNPGHLFYFRDDVYWHPRVNNARWNKKFER